MEELWKDIPNWEGYYQASNLGRIRSVPRRIWVEPAKTGRSQGHWINVKSTILRPCKRSGYYNLALCRDGKPEQCTVHQLIAQTWLNYRKEDGIVINHLNGIKTDNRVENIEITTISGNVQHAIKTGLVKVGFEATLSKLTIEDGKEMVRLRLEEHWSHQKIADKFNVSKPVVRRVMRRLGVPASANRQISKGNKKFITYMGKTLPVMEWAKELDVTYKVLYGRIKRGEFPKPQ